MKALFKQIFFLGRHCSFVGFLSCRCSKRGEGGWKWVLGRTGIHLHWAAWLGPQGFWTASVCSENLDSFFPNLSQHSWNTVFWWTGRREERKEREDKTLKKKKKSHTLFLSGFHRSQLAKWLQFPHSRWDLLSHLSGTLLSGKFLWKRQERPFSFPIGWTKEVAAEMLSSRAVSNLRTRRYSSGPERLSYGAVSQLWSSPCKDDYLLNRRSERIESHTCYQVVQFSSVQSLSRVRLFATPWIAARQASLSITISQSSLKLTSIESVMPSSHLILCRPLLLLPPIPPSIRVFSNESTLRMRWPNYWSFSFSIIPSKEHPGLMSFRMDWLDLLAVQGTLKMLIVLKQGAETVSRTSKTMPALHPLSRTGLNTGVLKSH